MSKRLLCICATIIILIGAYTSSVVNSKNKEIEILIQQNNNLRQELVNTTKFIEEQQIQINKIQEQINKLKSKRFLTEQDINSLERIVEAEARGEGVRGKRLVASVVLNRWNKSKDKTVHEIVIKPRQFQAVSNGKYYSIIPTKETKEAVNMAIYKDYSNGATYFRNPEISSRSTDRWFQQLQIVKRYKNHVFYKK